MVASCAPCALHAALASTAVIPDASWKTLTHLLAPTRSHPSSQGTGVGCGETDGCGDGIDVGSCVGAGNGNCVGASVGRDVGTAEGAAAASGEQH